MTYALLTVQGANRPGIVAEISRLLHEHRINISDSSMATLRREFVMMLLLELPAELTTEILAPAFATLADSGLRIQLQALDPAEATEPLRRPQPTHAISVLGPDQTGLVYHISAVLAAQQVNILDVDTQLLERPGRPLYAMVLEIDAGTADAEALTEALAEVGSRLGVDLQLHPVDYAEL